MATEKFEAEMNVMCPVHGFRRLGMLLIIRYAGQVIPQEAKLDELLNTYNPARKTARMRTRPKGRLIKPYHRTSDIIYLNAKALGWDWGVHSCRPR
jgi:hypothetical protein